MEIKNLTIEYSVEFKSNRGNFNVQPVFTLTKDQGLTADDFISLYRIRKTKTESASLTGLSSTADGRLGLTLGNANGLTSLTGSTRIKAQSLVAGDANLTADWGSEASVAGGTGNLNLLSTTGTEWRPEYDITINQIGTERFEIIVLDKNNDIYSSDMTITGIPVINDLRTLGNGIRPIGRKTTGDTTPTGGKGKAEILTYLFNKQEQQEQWTSSGLTGVFDLSFNGLTGALMGKAAGHGAMQTAGTSGSLVGATGPATVTGWAMGPVEGAFRFDNGGYVKSAHSTLFNTRTTSTSGMTFMTYVKFHGTGSNQNIMTIAGTETNPAFEIRLETSVDASGNAASYVVFNNPLASITAGSLSTIDQALNPNPLGMATGRTFELNRWYHIAAKISATSAPDSGMSIYIDGQKSLLARTLSGNPISSVVSGGTSNLHTSANTISMQTLTQPRMYLASNKAGSGAQIPIDYGLTRIFTRGLSDNEVFQNFIATIPSNVVLKSIKIG